MTNTNPKLYLILSTAILTLMACQSSPDNSVIQSETPSTTPPAAETQETKEVEETSQPPTQIALQKTEKPLTFTGTIEEVFDTGLGPFVGVSLKDEAGETANFNIENASASDLPQGKRLQVDYIKTTELLVVAGRLTSEPPLDGVQTKEIQEFHGEEKLYTVVGEYIEGVQGDQGVYVDLKDKAGNTSNYTAVFDADLDNTQKYQGKEVELTYIEKEKVIVTNYQVIE